MLLDLIVYKDFRCDFLIYSTVVSTRYLDFNNDYDNFNFCLISEFLIDFNISDSFISRAYNISDPWVQCDQ